MITLSIMTDISFSYREECSTRSGDDNTSFSLVHRGDSVKLRCGGSRIAASWLTAINAARDSSLSAIAARGGSR
jgi:hypothetical protein